MPYYALVQNQMGPPTLGIKEVVSVIRGGARKFDHNGFRYHDVDRREFCEAQSYLVVGQRLLEQLNHTHAPCVDEVHSERCMILLGLPFVTPVSTKDKCG